jgi:hypothetical protein
MDSAQAKQSNEKDFERLAERVRKAKMALQELDVRAKEIRASMIKMDRQATKPKI